MFVCIAGIQLHNLVQCFPLNLVLCLPRCESVCWWASSSWFCEVSACVLSIEEMSRMSTPVWLFFLTILCSVLCPFDGDDVKDFSTSSRNCQSFFKLVLQREDLRLCLFLSLASDGHLGFFDPLILASERMSSWASERGTCVASLFVPQIEQILRKYFSAW